MKRDEVGNRDAVGEEGVGPLFEAARVMPTVEERRRILAAAEPMLAEHRKAAERAVPADRSGARAATVAAVPWADRFRALITPRRALAAGVTAAVVAAVVLMPRPAAVRETRSAPVVTWIEYQQPDPTAPFPLASASFGRPY